MYHQKTPVATGAARSATLFS